MTNVSETLRRSSEWTPWKKIRSFFYDSDMYSADDVADFVTNAPDIPYAWNKRLFSSAHVIGVMMLDVNFVVLPPHLQKLPKSLAIGIADASGATIVRWTDPPHLLPASYTFQEARETQGLLDRDRLFAVALRYLVTEDLAFINWVEKRPPRRLHDRIPEKKRRPDVFDLLSLHPQPA